MKYSYGHIFLGCVALGCSSALFAQSATMNVGEGVVIQGDSSGSATVRVGGVVINAVSGKGAVAETNIGSHNGSHRVPNGEMGNASIVTVDGNGTHVKINHATNETVLNKADKAYVNADLSGRNFFRANLSGHTFVNVTLAGANLREANLRNTEFVNVDFTKADLTGADVTGATFVNADIGVAIQGKR